MKTSHKRFIGLLSLMVILALVGFLYLLLASAGVVPGLPVPEGSSQLACPTESQLCADGSTVSRTGPTCAFALCPPEIVSTSTVEVEQPPVVPPATVIVSGTGVATLGTPVLIGGVTITPLEVIEDSRCPVDVQCIQAGTVRLLVLADDTQVTLTLNQAVVQEGRTIALLSVAPEARSNVSSETRAYKFTIEVNGTVN